MWRVFSGFLFFLLGLFLLTALLSPPVFWVIDALLPDAFPFKRVFNRVLMMDALLLLVPLLWYWEISKTGWREKMGLVAGTQWWRNLLCGWILGVISISSLVTMMLMVGGRIWVPELMLGKALGYFATGGVVGVLEEILFRGVFFLAILYLTHALHDWKKLLIVALVSSIFYSVAHFAKARHIEGDVSWLSGFEVWGTIFMDERGWANLGMRGFGLFLVGLCLCALVYRYRNIWAAVGLHAGWVFAQKSLEKLTDRVAFSGPEAWKNFLWGSDLVSGWASFLMLAVVLTVCLLSNKSCDDQSKRAVS